MFDRARMAVRTAAEQKRRMARAGIAHDFCIEISVHIGCSDEVLLEFSTESLIQTDKNEFGMLRRGSSGQQTRPSA